MLMPSGNCCGSALETLSDKAMTRTPFEERFQFAQHLLECKHAYTAASVIRLGQVHFTDEVETAGIVASGTEVRLLFNRDFSERSNILQLGGVLVHDAM